MREIALIEEISWRKKYPSNLRDNIGMPCDDRASFFKINVCDVRISRDDVVRIEPTLKSKVKQFFLPFVSSIVRFWPRPVFCEIIVKDVLQKNCNFLGVLKKSDSHSLLYIMIIRIRVIFIWTIRLFVFITRCERGSQTTDSTAKHEDISGEINQRRVIPGTDARTQSNDRHINTGSLQIGSVGVHPVYNDELHRFLLCTFVWKWKGQLDVNGRNQLHLNGVFHLQIIARYVFFNMFLVISAYRFDEVIFLHIITKYRCS